MIPAAFLSNLLGPVAFYGPLLYRMTNLEAGAVEQTQAHRAIVAVGQTSLTAFLVATGLLLVVFVEPPTRWWVGGDAYSGDKRPTLLAVDLESVFILLMAAAPLRNAFALQPLSPLNTALTLAATVAWPFLERGGWLAELLERFFVLD